MNRRKGFDSKQELRKLFDRIFRAVPGYARTRLGNGGMWARNVQLGRLRLGYTIYKHVYPTCPDRWVIQPEIIWDRG